jgi:hypothetical protein
MATWNSRLSGAALALALVFTLAVIAGGVRAEGDAALSAEGVVEAQLLALQHNDDPAPDAGIARTFELAHPDNRRFTGPLERFTAMVKSPGYRPLIGHTRHTIAPLEQSGAEANFLVTIEAADGTVVEYLWTVAPDAEGRWLTTRVSPPRPAGVSA